MHSLDHLPEEVIDAIVDYTLQRVRIDPPLDHPSTEVELRELVGPTITEQGIGGLRCQDAALGFLEPLPTHIQHGQIDVCDSEIRLLGNRLQEMGFRFRIISLEKM